MAIYRQVHISFWQDEFILNLTPEEKFFYLYLMTNSKTTQCGIYELPRKIIEFETGYNAETVEKLLQRFIKYGKIKYSNETKEIMLTNWMKHNANTSPRVVSRIEKELKSVKNPEYKKAFYTVCKQYRYPIQTETQQEPEPEEEKEPKEEEGPQPLDATETEREILKTLKAIPNYPIEFTQDLDMIRTLAIDYPTVDILGEVKKWRDYKRDKPIKNKSSPRLQLRNWMKNAKKWSDERATPSAQLAERMRIDV